MKAPHESPAPRILVVGYNAFDVILSVGEFPDPDEKMEVPRMVTCGGGPGATAAVALARLGASVRIMTPLTDDVAGRLQKEELVSAGVDISLCPVLSGFQSPKAVILVDEEKSHRTIFWSRGDVPHLAGSLAGDALLDDTDLLYVDGHEPELSRLLAERARGRGIPVVMDAGSVRSGSSELVAWSSDVVSSRNFAPDLTGCPHPLEALHALRERGPGRVAMTFGEEGVVGLEGDRAVAVPAFEVPVADTTGAGDAFHAGYAFATARGMEFLECLDWGCAVAALKCRDWGGRRGLPDRVETETLLRDGIRVSATPLESRLDTPPV